MAGRIAFRGHCNEVSPVVHRKVQTQPGLFFTVAHKETSLVIDVLTRDFGRIALIAKGAKRPYSQLRPCCRLSSRCN
jgi:recombinational DNA repair protein (RecF pathway)